MSKSSSRTTKSSADKQQEVKDIIKSRMPDVCVIPGSIVVHGDEADVYVNPYERRVRVSLSEKKILWSQGG